MSLPVHPSWEARLAPVEDQIHQLGDFLRAQPAYLPAGNDILRAFQDPFDDVRVLIVGQDPYPTPGHPMGLSFSTQPGVAPPRSLVNIYSELQGDLGIPPRRDGDLSSWASQGILLLNRVLTVAPGQPGSHRGKGWEQVTETAIRALAERGTPRWQSCGVGTHRPRSAFSATLHALNPPTRRPCPPIADSSVPARSPAPMKRCVRRARTVWTGHCKVRPHD